MIFNIEFWNRQMYLPTKKHKRLRMRYIKSNVDVEIKEVTESQFPVAFIIHDYQSVSENAKTYDEFDKTEFGLFDEEIRTYNGNLYMPVRVSHGSAISLCFEPLDYIKEKLSPRFPHDYYEKNGSFTVDSIIKDDNIEECKKSIFLNAESYIIYEGKVWEECGEPMYEVRTFGIGNNHGGTGFFILYIHKYDDDIGYENYFNALQREQSIAYGKKVAIERGDTEFVANIGKYDNIEVLMPEMVRKDPQEKYEEKRINKIKKEIMNGFKTLYNACNQVPLEFCNLRCPYKDICSNKPRDWELESIDISEETLE